MLVTSMKHGKAVFARLLRVAHWLVLDCETVPKPEYSDDPEATLVHPRMRINIFSAAYRGESYSFATNLVRPSAPTMAEWAEALNEFLSEFFALRTYSRRLVFHNFNYDGRVFDDMGAPMFRFPIWDTMIGGWMSNASVDKALKARAPLYGRHIQDTKTVNFDDERELSAYAESDVIQTDEIFQMQFFGQVVRPMFNSTLNEALKIRTVKNPMVELKLKVPSEDLTSFDRLFLDYQELPVLRSTIRAENRGVPVHTQSVNDIAEVLKKAQRKHKQTIFGKAKKLFNLDSNDQLGEVMSSLGVQSTKKTKKGKESWKAEALFYLTKQHPIVGEVLAYRKVSKLLGTYMGEEGLLRYLNPRTGCIHPSLNPVGAVTGRHSSSKPNLQNIPARADKYGIKKCFRVKKDDEWIICLDFSQIELRIMAVLSKDKRMSEVLNDPDGDIHQATSDGLHVPRDPVAKQCNFLIIFGGGGRVLADRLTLEGIPTEKNEADNYIADFDSLYCSVKEYRLKMLEFHRVHGYVPLLTGRRRVIENVDSSNTYLLHRAETQLANNSVQGSAQDICKMAIVRCDPLAINPDLAILRTNYGSSYSPKLKAMLTDQGRLLEKRRAMFRKVGLGYRLQVHDELFFTVRCSQASAIETAQSLSNILGWRPYWDTIVPMDVVVRADGGIGKSWGESKKPSDKALKVKSELEFFDPSF